MARNHCTYYFPILVKGGKGFGVGSTGCYKTRGEAVKRARTMVWRKGIRSRRSAWVCDSKSGKLVRVFGDTKHVRCPE